MHQCNWAYLGHKKMSATYIDAVELLQCWQQQLAACAVGAGRWARPVQAQDAVQAPAQCTEEHT